MGRLKRVFAGLFAAVLLFGAADGARATTADLRGSWTEGSTVQSTPFLHSSATHRAVSEARQHQRLPRLADVPLLTASSLSPVRAGSTAASVLATTTRPAVVIVASGYDATAPPAS